MDALAIIYLITFTVIRTEFQGIFIHFVCSNHEWRVGFHNFDSSSLSELPDWI